ncbi:MAG: hypothetical protein A2583_11410 [Bdellovibrionales bacterium RIFOXYD1_FULL_53_11]|nr:MAG: hypothetical protein A2583_11410 [Bdellovibrionales bacterium RIFOXYD1_FULL_53_11]
MTQARILVVDDDLNMRETLAMMLEMAGFNAAKAEDGLAARELMQSGDFDLVISDIKMPRMNGIELFTWNKQNKNIPTILITGFADIIETKEAFEMGVLEFLAKPFDNEEIMSAVMKTLETKKA